MIINLRKALFCVVIVSLFPAAAHAGHFGSAMSKFQQKASQYKQQGSQSNGQPGGGLMNSFKNKVSQHMGHQQNGQPTTQGQVATNQPQNKLGKMRTLFDFPNIDPGSVFGKIDPTTGLPFPAGGGGTTTPPAGGGGTTTPPTGGGGTTTPTTPPAPTTPPMPTTPPTGDMGNGGHHNHGSWIPQVVGAIIQARAASNANYYDNGYSTPVYQAPVYQTPVYAAPAPVQYAPAPVQQYAAPVQYQAPVQAPAPANSGLVIYAVEQLQGANGQLLVRGEGFGTQNGQLVLDINGVRMGMEVVSWIPNAVVVKFPSVQVPQGATVSFTAVRTDGAASQPFNPATAGTVAAR